MKLNIIALECLIARRGMTQVQAAKMAGMSKQYFSTVKTRGTCTPLTAVKIADALGVDVTEILEKEV